MHDFLTVGAAAPLTGGGDGDRPASSGRIIIEKLLETYTEKRALFSGGSGPDRAESITCPQGTYFVLVDICEFLELPQFRGFSGSGILRVDDRSRLASAAVPGSSFFREEVNNLIRLHFAREKETLDEALGRLEKLKELK